MIDRRLTAAELDEAIRRNRIPRIPKGCDQQGRYPQANEWAVVHFPAEAATEIGADQVRNDVPIWRMGPFFWGILAGWLFSAAGTLLGLAVASWVL